MSWNAMVMQIKTTMNVMIMTTIDSDDVDYYGHQPEVDFIHPWALVLPDFRANPLYKS